MFALTDLLRWRAELHPDAMALVDEYGEDVSYSQLQNRIVDCVTHWQKRGVSAGQVVALLDTSSAAFVVNLFALARLGAVPALLNWRLTSVEHRALLTLVEPVAIAAGQALIDQLPEELPAIRVALHADERCPAGWVRDDTESPTAESDAHGQAVGLPPSPSPSDVFAIGFSSGTTGRPKGIPMRHEALLRSVLVDSPGIEPMRQGARHLSVAPLFHLAGLSNLLMGLTAGAEVHLRAAFDPAAILADIERLGIEFMTGVPAMFRALVAASKELAPPADTGSMLEMTYGASPIAPELVREMNQLFPRSRFRQFYGMTEIAGALTTLSPADHDPSSPHSASAGQVNPGFEVRLVDRHGEDVADGMPGEILVKGSSVLHGYWNAPDVTAEAIVDGWFKTGDIAIRSEGYLSIMDRAKDMVVTGGENVYPAEVEAVLYEHNDVADAAVIGVPDERFGERVHAVIVAQPGATIELHSLTTFARARLAGYKLPRSMELVDELPRNPTGKVLKRELRSPHWEDKARPI
ncbi:MAG: class I adenylate-forming enzyme family protein [Acidimicrobiales bacterium]